MLEICRIICVSLHWILKFRLPVNVGIYISNGRTIKNILYIHHKLVKLHRNFFSSVWWKTTKLAQTCSSMGYQPRNNNITRRDKFKLRQMPTRKSFTHTIYSLPSKRKWFKFWWQTLCWSHTFRWEGCASHYKYRNQIFSCYILDWCSAKHVQSVEGIWLTFVMTWCTIYTGYPNRLRTDQGFVFTSERWNN